MNRTLKSALGLTLLAAALASCNTTPPAPSPVIGTWVGKWGNAALAPTTNYAMIIRPDGTMSVYDNVFIGDPSKPNNVGTGTWTYTGDTLKTKYRYNGSSTDIYTSAKLANPNRLEGKWGLNETVDGGTYFLDRQ